MRKILFLQHRVAFSALFAATSAGLVVSTDSASGLTLSVNTTYDVGGFFSNPQAAATLDAAAAFYTHVLADTLDPIAPGPRPGGGFNNWEVRLSNPGTGEDPYDPTTNPDGFRIINPTIPADTVVIYAGAYDLNPTSNGGTLGIAGPGGWSGSGNSAWFDTIRNRGESGTTTGGANEFAPYGGRVSITTDVNWNLDYREMPEPNENDLYTVLLHEIAHVLGLGTADSWFTRAIGGEFRGNAARVANGGSFVPLQSGGGHWAPFVDSSIYGTADDTISLTAPITQETALDPDVLVGTRKIPTTLDLAGLDDVGWELAPLVFGDLDYDQTLTTDDADLIVQHFGQASQPYQERFDFDASGVVDPTDLRTWIDDAALTTPGDTDLDGDVDALDAATLIANYTGLSGGGIYDTSKPSWALGNFDGDGDIDFADAMALRNNVASWASVEVLAMLDGALVSVPEPTLALPLLAMGLGLRRRPEAGYGRGM
ncbi:MAG: matrixin family metalloprotease [Planctomycetota bacterium]